MTQTLNMAVTKGRLLESSLVMFDKMGFDCQNIKEPGRRLMLDIINYPLSIVLAKAADVITYVEHGFCSIGIVGKDTLLEHGGSYYETLDLGFGRCRFVLAGLEGINIEHHRTLRVATKYPNVARRYFLSRGMDVSIIRIEGSVELGPILGISDVIVDIVESGNTLRANGLVIYDEIYPVSARLIVNTAAMKLYKEQILDFIEKCREVCNDKHI